MIDDKVFGPEYPDTARRLNSLGRQLHVDVEPVGRCGVDDGADLVAIVLAVTELAHNLGQLFFVFFELFDLLSDGRKPVNRVVDRPSLNSWRLR